ncbi:MAG: spore maturation protein [Elusimicrobia bacterium RIFOXYA2_FULL_39_19]|nr:MAG: spore maturation protein [Elusimicrobia bacterium RIFOXYA2_FULL_39_19]
MNIIFILLITISVVFAIANNRVEEFTTAVFDSTKLAVEISLMLLAVISLWLGLIKILEDSGIIHNLSKIFRPVIKRLFKNIPDDHPAITSITLNFLANLFGIGNAATPLGIKAMQDLQTLNEDKETITFEMMLFIVINTSSIQLVPFTVIGILSGLGSKNPTAIVLPIILATVISSVIAITNLFVFRKFLGKGK